MDKFIYKTIFFIISVLIYIDLMVFIDRQYPYYYTDLFVDEWIIMSITTILYFVTVVILALTINYIRKSIKRKKIMYICMTMGLIITILAAGIICAKTQRKELQKELDEAHESNKWIEKANRRIQEEYLDASIKSSDKSQK